MSRLCCAIADSPSLNLTSNATVVNVCQIDRWRICHRLQELMIPCKCLPDASLQVEVNDPVAAV